MTVADQIKILGKKSKQNEAQYDLDRKAAKISAISSEKLNKYEYFTGEDLGYEMVNIQDDTKKNYDRWKKIIYGFKHGILPLAKKDAAKTDSADQQLNILDMTEEKKFNGFLRPD